MAMRPFGGAQLLLAVALHQHVAPAAAHSSLLIPPARNAVDRDLPPYRGGKFGRNLSYGLPPDNFGCDCVNATTGGAVACEVGQSCLWFSNGCSIGCPTCDGGNISSPTGGANPSAKDRCGSGKKQTLDPSFRTALLDVPYGSKADEYRFNPWRAPGTAPVFDACGMAGGNARAELGEAKFLASHLAKQGDRGSQLPPRPSGTVWTAGGKAQTAISIRANHGGGYSFRLCPASSALTEDCFRRSPLSFVAGKQTLRWADGSEQLIGGNYTTHGTSPPNSSWARLPLPYRYCHSHTHPPTCESEFEPPCHETGYNHSAKGKPGNPRPFGFP
jgi:hypothetical protein